MRAVALPWIRIRYGMLIVWGCRDAAGQCFAFPAGTESSISASSMTRERLMEAAATAPEEAAMIAPCIMVPASPATYTPSTVVSFDVGSPLTTSGIGPIASVSHPSAFASPERWRWGGA